MNSVMDPGIDRLSGAAGPGGRDPLEGCTVALGLTDLWRAHNPQIHQYTHSSAAHNSQSRIDYLHSRRRWGNSGEHLIRHEGSWIIPLWRFECRSVVRMLFCPEIESMVLQGQKEQGGLA